MSQLDEFADNVNDIVAGHNERFRKLNDAKRALQVKGNEIADRWEDYFTNEAKKLQQANDALNRISNVPLSTSTSTVAKSTVLSEVPKVVSGG
jgi:hypothetical protein